MKNHKIITLAGSMKYYNEFFRIGSILSSIGHIVLSPFNHNNYYPNDQFLNDDVKKTLKEVQNARIDMSTDLFVINKNKYIGKDTKEEIEYATNKGLIIEYLEPLNRMRIATLIGSGKFLNLFKSVSQILTLKGFIVNTPAIFENESFMKGDVELSEENHKMYDEVHQQKMSMSDIVVLIHENQYIGKDTREEIEYCSLRGIPVIDYEKILFDESKFPESKHIFKDEIKIIPFSQK